MFIGPPYLLFVIEVLAVGLLGPRPLLGPVLAVLFGTGLYQTYVRGRSVSDRWETCLAVGALIVSMLYTTALGEHYVYVIRYWLGLMLVIRAYRRMTKRDYAFCFLISAALFAHIGRTYSELPFLFLCLAHIIILPYALFHFLAVHGGFQKLGTVRPHRPPGFAAAQIRIMCFVSLELLVVSTVLFLALPRPAGINPLAAAMDGQDAATGFSDKIPLGSFSRISEQGRIVMTVETDRPTLWRGEALDLYDKGIWYQTARFACRRPNQPVPPEASGPRITRRFELFDARLTNFKLPSAGRIVTAREEKDTWNIWINDLYSTIFLREMEVANFHGTYVVEGVDGLYTGHPQLRQMVWRPPPPNKGSVRETDLFLQVPQDLSPRVRNLA